MDRVLFGSNTIFVFKYPLLKRKMQQLKMQIFEANSGFSGEELESLVREKVINISLISTDEEVKSGDDEDESRRKQMTVEDYNEDEIDEDINGIDWDFAYNEILKIDERKRDKAKLE